VRSLSSMTMSMGLENVRNIKLLFKTSISREREVRERQREGDRERESVRSIIIRSNGGGGGATRRADGQIHNVSRARRRRSCRRGPEGRLSCASPPRRGRDARTRVAAAAVNAVGLRRESSPTIVSRKGDFQSVIKAKAVSWI